MPGRIVKAVDKRGRRFNVTEQEAEDRGLTVLGKTQTSDATRTKKSTRRKKG